MIDELNKYRVEILKIIGFAMLSPFGRLFLQPLEIFKEYGLILTMCYAIMSIATGLLGFVIIIRGYEIIEEDKLK